MKLLNLDKDLSAQKIVSHASLSKGERKSFLNQYYKRFRLPEEVEEEEYLKVVSSKMSFKQISSIKKYLIGLRRRVNELINHLDLLKELKEANELVND